MTVSLITNTNDLEDLRRSWAGVEKLRDRITHVAFAATAFPIGAVYPAVLAEAAYNLPLVHAFGVLHEALRVLADEGVITPRNRNDRRLGALIGASKTLPWQNRPAIEAGVALRNGIAHDGALLPRQDCLRLIAAISDELRGWGVLRL